MYDEVALAGALIAFGVALFVAVRGGSRLRAGLRPGRPDPDGDGGGLDSIDSADADVVQVQGQADSPDLPFTRMRWDHSSRSALTASLFAAAPADHIWWTVLVTDPALHETPSHLRLVGHYQTEVAAVGAADQLADVLNTCLVPGEAPLTASALGIEPETALGIEPETALDPKAGARAANRDGPGAGDYRGVTGDGPGEAAYSAAEGVRRAERIDRIRRPESRGNVALT